MARGKRGTGSKAAVWVILILLIIGLAGFGATNFGGTVNAIGTVGDREIGVQRYARSLQEQMQAFSAQIGTNLTLAQAQAFGIDRAVLQQLVSTAALENEATQLGLSAGDEQVRSQILSIPAFQLADGSFNRESYRFALQGAGLNEREFEENLRAEIARTLLQGAVAGGIVPPAIYTDTLLNYIGERRNFAWAALNADALETPIPEPTDADLQAYFDANEADFMLPETREITYVWLTPDMIVDTVDIDEEALRQLYEDRIDEFVKPERRLVERLILGEAAGNARERLDSGEITFEGLVAERLLSLADIDMGDVTEDELDEAGPEVFAATEPGIVGPIETDIGPVMFRINAILAAQETTFEQARPDLVEEFAMDRARRIVADQISNIDDLLAGGATLEEIADETTMRLGQIDYFEGADNDIAAYDGFRSAAETTEQGDFPEVLELGDGSIFALRVDQVIAPRLQPFDEARETVADSWRAAQTAQALADQASLLADALKSGEDPATLNLALTAETDITRERTIGGTPPEFLEAVFQMTEGEVRVITGDAAAYLVRLDSIAPPDPENEDTASTRERLSELTAQTLGADILQAYSNAVQAKAGISLNQAAINAVHTQFP